ncbi:ead/Ea22-like family protein [Enterobacter hormaechei]|uniref:ead/Ea22-like family protein n=1 Tax=Enterobacter hormaechei TaxID=158836 RepID=UPI0023E45C6F|nr:ead/Ea22-like family protein [Enterobacter hormaechei]MDF3686143.1 ead/Ea22-like family protein [Enterobacter hormaechei]
MSHIDKRALREAAEKATPGRIGDRVDGSIKYTCRGTDGTLVLSTDNHDDYGFVGDNSLEDELFFRLCDPVTVLALLDELEAKDKLNAELMEKQRLIDICQGQGLEYRIAAEKRAETAEKRVAELEVLARGVKQFSEFQICHYGATEDYAKGYIDCQNNYNKVLFAAAGKGEAS